jgi:hypothetical protein
VYKTRIETYVECFYSNIFFRFSDDDRICCNSAEQQATGYVLMGRGSEYLIAPIGSAVSPSNHHNRRDTDSLLRQVRDKVRSRRTSSGDSADHSSEQDSSESCESIVLYSSVLSITFAKGSRSRAKFLM